MSSVDVTVEDTVALTTIVGDRHSTRPRIVLAAIVVTQLAWLASLVYGAVWLVT
jgi:hypothetical protein